MYKKLIGSNTVMSWISIVLRRPFERLNCVYFKFTLLKVLLFFAVIRLILNCIKTSLKILKFLPTMKEEFVKDTMKRIL